MMKMKHRLGLVLLGVGAFLLPACGGGGGGGSSTLMVIEESSNGFGKLLPHRVFKQPAAEAYFLPWAQALREQVETKVILVGGLRRTETMAQILDSGDADFISLSRPLLREPDLVRQLEAGRTGLVDCTSCNICVLHMEIDPLRCWRKPRWRLFDHAARRFTGRLNPKRLDTG